MAGLINTPVPRLEIAPNDTDWVTAPASTPRSLINNTEAMKPQLSAADAYNVNLPAVAQNMRDAMAAAQDPQTWRDAAKAYGEALLAGSVAPGGAMSAGKIAGQIEKYASHLGYGVERSGSNISGSKYLSLTHEALGEPLKVRISDHDLPPSYGPPGDYDVRPVDAWQDVVKSLADRVGQPMPKASDLAAATKAAKADSFSGQMELLKKAYPGEFSASSMRDLAARYEADNPGKVSWTPHWGIQR